MTILETKDLCFAYKDGGQKRTILNHVNVKFEKGIFYTILGASGSGKTTFLSLIGGLETQQEGIIEYLGTDINQIGLDAYRRYCIAMIFQNYNLITYMSALENVMMAMGISQNSRKINEADAYLYLKEVGISKTDAKRRVTHLSGGEQQRVAIARALSTNVDIIMADEPTGNLDHETSMQIVSIFKNLAYKKNKCIIMVTHDREIALQSDVILQLDSSVQNFTTNL